MPGPNYPSSIPQLGATYNSGAPNTSPTSTFQQPGVFGTGQYQVAPINIDQSTFQNPLAGQVRGQLGSEINNYLPNATAPVTAATAAGGGQGVFNGGLTAEQSLAAQYAKMAAGQGPSLATVMANQEGANNIAAGESMLGSARGAGSPGAAQLGARNLMSTQGQQIAGNAVAGRTAEELGALSAEGGLDTSIAGQGLTEQQLQAQANQFNASQRNQIAQGNQSTRLGGNTNYLGFLGNQGLGWGQLGAQGAGLSANTQLGLEGLQNNAFNSAAGRNQQLASGIASGVAGVGASIL